jgi:hypothetical protein
MQIRHLALIILALAGCDQAPKQETNVIPAPNMCFEISSNNPATVGPILLDKCTGNTWVLLRSRVFDDQGKPSKDFEWAWFKVDRTDITNTVEGR